MYFYFNLSYWLRLLLIVCGDVKSNLSPGSDKRVQVRYPNIRGLHANLDELTVPGSDYDVLVCAESKVSNHRHLSELRMPGFVVSDSNAHHSEWLESVSLTDRHVRDALDFCNLSCCEQLVLCPTHIAGNRLDLVMTNVPDIVDVFIGTPLGTSGHYFASCVIRVEQSVS